jgi:FkbM family methyltransferase
MFDFSRFRSLKSKGFTPDIVLDIGAYHGHWTSQMKHIYESAIFHLFEAIDYQELSIFSSPFLKEKSNSSSTQRFSVHIALLSDTAGKTVDWYEMRNTGDSMFREKTRWFADCAVIKRTTTTLDTFSNLFVNNKRILMKIDCQGAEIDILHLCTFKPPIYIS